PDRSRHRSAQRAFRAHPRAPGLREGGLPARTLDRGRGEVGYGALRVAAFGVGSPLARPPGSVARSVQPYFVRIAVFFPLPGAQGWSPDSGRETMTKRMIHWVLAAIAAVSFVVQASAAGAGPLVAAEWLGKNLDRGDV